MTKRILAVQLADIGDLVLTTPALAALREAQPDAHIALLTSAHSAKILPAGLVDEVLTFDKHLFDSLSALIRPANLKTALGLAGALRRGRYDTTVFFHHFTTKFGALKFAAMALAAGSSRRLGLDNGNAPFLTERVPDGGFGAKHQAEYWLDLVARLGANSAPRPALVASAESALLPPKTEGRPRIVIHPGSGGYSRARRWEPERFAALADFLTRDHNAEVIMVGSKDDDNTVVEAKMQTRPLDLTGQTSLPELSGILRTADLFIGTDSGVMHIAAASGAPVLVIFGPSNADAWGPWTPDGRVSIVSSLPECSPCSYVGHGIGLRHGCEARTCIRMVTVAQMRSAARVMLSGGTLPRPVRPPHQPLTNRLHILGIPVDAITYERWLELLAEWIDANRMLPGPQHLGRCHHVCTVNPEFVMVAQEDSNFRNILQRAHLCVPDGVGLLWAAKRLGRPLVERVTGSDGVPLIAQRAAREGWRLFLLGAAEGVADKAAEVLTLNNPGLKIVGTYSGSPQGIEEDELVEQVNASGADILFVAYGAPTQDKWIARNLPRLRPAMAIGVGGSFDFIAGIVPRAPLWMRERGLEWLYRLYLQPWRIKRMLRLPRFVLAFLRWGEKAPE